MELENFSSLPVGLFVHFGPLCVFYILRYLEFNFFLAMGIPGVVFTFMILVLEKYYPNSPLTHYSHRQVLTFIMDTVIYAFMFGTPFVYATKIFLDWLTPWRISEPNLLMAFVAFISTDIFYYLLHRYLYHTHNTKSFILNWFRKVHTAHHTVNELDLIRGSHAGFIDNAVLSFQLPVSFFCWLYGLDMETTLWVYASSILLQATHHANFTFDIGLLRYVFMDNHAHKFHHCIGGTPVNFGVVFCVWDRLLSTYYDNHKLNPNHIHAQRYSLNFKTSTISKIYGKSIKR